MSDPFSYNLALILHCRAELNRNNNDVTEDFYKSTAHVITCIRFYGPDFSLVHINCHTFYVDEKDPSTLPAVKIQSLFSHVFKKHYFDWSSSIIKV